MVKIIYYAFSFIQGNRWSDWYLGDSQTMLSIKRWNEEGWIKSRLLFIPQGYAKVVYYFTK